MVAMISCVSKYLHGLLLALMAVIPINASLNATHLPEPQISVSEDGETIYLIGPIAPGTFLQFSHILRRNVRVKNLFLASSGGVAVEALLIGNRVRQRGLNTYVEHYCASACTNIFASGKERTAGPYARFGFHRSFLVGDDGYIVEDSGFSKESSSDEKRPPTLMSEALGLDGDDATRLAYRRAGINEAFLDKVLQVPGEDMWHPDAAELADSGLFTRPAGSSKLPLPKTSIGFEASEAELLAKPLWQAGKRYDPVRYSEIVLDYWRYRNIGIEQEKALLAARTKYLTLLYNNIWQAQDPLLDRFALNAGALMALARRQNYPQCGNAKLHSELPGAEEMQLLAAEDALFVELLSQPVQAAKIPPEKAKKQFGKLSREIAQTGLIQAYKDEKVTKCRIYAQQLEAIARLESKKRIRAYRALLSLP